ncbi:PspA/IM30 family protein [Ktedonospora formicarum]|uniref:Phage shock protein A n=1 Tax=Ktedonospora formicarum TaxID=2778364 RepID=A0A8J3MW95_9CHLR|nr:PspA/IM30 family protein [Ktedonospora formicarum]GHO50125.1 phage shock protein A [Ktedonospora formicarum]
MGFFSRLLNFLRIRSNAALYKAEEPGEVMDYSYTKQREQVQQIRRAVADIATSEKQLELQQTELLNKVEKITGQARQALAAGREDLARMALQRKEALVTQLNASEQQIAQVRAQKERLIQMERDVAARVETFHTQKEIVKARYNASQAQVKLHETLSGLSGEMEEVNQAMQRAQEKILLTQARANALDNLLEQGVIGEQTYLGGDTLDRELQKIASQQNVELQLEAMKEQLQLGGPNTQPKQIEGPTSSIE